MIPACGFPALDLGALLERCAAHSPQAICWEEAHSSAEPDPPGSAAPEAAEPGPLRVWRYAQLAEGARGVAQALLAAGLPASPHERSCAPVAICAGNGFRYLCVQFGAAQAGFVLAHLPAGSPGEELARLLQHCEAQVVFLGSAQSEAAAAARTQVLAVRVWVWMDETPPPPWALAWREWQHGTSPTRRHVLPPAAQRAPIDPQRPFQLIYTSGSTATPRGVLISHRAKLAQGAVHALNLGLQPGDRILFSLPLYHQFAQWLVGVSALLSRAAVRSAPRFHAGEHWRILRQEPITHLAAVPTMLHRLLQDPAAQGPAPRHLRQIVYGGAPSSLELVRALRQAFPGVRLFQGFGQTESGFCLGLHDAEHDLRPESLGTADLFSELRVVDAQGQEVPLGEIGELIVRTPYQMCGYLKDAQANAAYFAFGAGWGRTGDLVRRDAAGYYMHAGRASEIVISGGVNIAPGEVEAVLLRHAALDDVAVLGLPDATWGERLVAAFAVRSGAPVPRTEDLHRHCRAALRAVKCPKSFYCLDELPRTPSGKLQKPVLRRLLAQLLPLD